ncbi:MAG TPA: protein kinase, partial [Pirellulaceae bacterium]|nr:protein kinase [Pirellulaceae bacterium]
MNERELFIATLQLDESRRADYLNKACTGDASMRQRVEALLAAFGQAGSFLQPSAPEPSPTIDGPSERSGMQIGPYKLVEQIGEGGMGTVWKAQQSEPVKRLVAIKLIKAGMDSRQVIARFDAERQALALMDHANIARVLDAGTTPAGRPYFVMDLVRGVPITRYCDEHHLTPRERLELFIPVCQAVQHAHQKGVIHRDIKPSNVLVALYDGRPVPKVIDFGVAKAAGQSLTDKTLVTGFGTIVGTLEYMSPEQAETNQLDIDTRSDIYSLGVLLYELLTGSTPFSRKELENAGMLEMLRVIREEEPSKPSTKLSTAEGLPTLAANRGTEPGRLTRLVRGELDWIVMKALEKDRNRRYETANGFAMDVQRYLADEHVQACPPSAGYRLRKFARRYKGALATTAIVAAALVLGSVVSVWQAVRATNALQAEKKARRDAEIATEGEKTQRGVAQLQKTLAEKNATRAEANFGKARKAVEEYLTKITENELLRVPGLQPLREDLLKAALKFYTEFTQERAGDPTLRQELASAHLLLARIQGELDNSKAARAANLESIRLYEQLRADAERGKSEASVEVQVGLATGYFLAGRYDDTEKLCQHVLQIAPKHAEVRGLLSDTYNELGKAANDKNDVPATFKHYQRAFDLREGLVRDFPDNAAYLARLGGTLNNLGNLLSNQKQDEEALAMYERSIDYTAQAYEREPHSIVWGRWLCIQLGNAASKYDNLDRRDQALATLERLVAVSRKRSFENPAVSSLRGDLYKAYLRLGTYQKEVGDAAGASKNFRLAREVLEQIPRETPKDLFELARVYAVLASPPADAASSSENQSDADERQRNADLAIATLQKAVAGGFQDPAELAKYYNDFDSLRGRSDFQEIAATVQKLAEANQKLAQASRQDPATQLASQQQAAALLKDLATAQPGQERHRTTLATTLQSIGMVQTGLKQYEAAEKSMNDAIALWRELAAAQPNNPQLQVSLIGAQMALGACYRESGRPAEAHRVWQECLASLDQVRQRQAADTTLGKQIALKEAQICDLYGRLGAFSLAAEYSRRSVRLQRSLGAWPDVDYGVVLGVLQGDEALRELCRVVDRERTRAGGPPFTDGDLANLGKTSNLLNPPPLPPEQSLKWIEEAAKANPDSWRLYLLALAQHRAGKSADAQATFEKVRTSKDLSTVFAGALIAHGAGQPDLARERLMMAEAIFVQFCQQTLQGSTVGLASPISQSGHWWALTAPVLLRREAWRLIDGQTVPEEAWLRLMEARAAHLLGDSAKRDEQLAAADSRDSNVWLARARLTEEWGQLDQSAEVAWQRAIDAAPADPVPWIHRGRWCIQRGEQVKADADFAKAAALSPDTLNRFLQAGWWVAGPYPKGLKEFCPPEVDPDPSRPVHLVDPKTGLSEQPLAWRPVPSGETGKIDLKATFNADQISAYGLNIVYSPAERPATLRLSGDGGLRLWLNGELVYEADPAPTWQWANEGLVPVTLRAGRNLVMVKVSQSTQKHSFSLRVSDEAVDRAFLLAEWGLWQEAAEQMALAAPSDFREDSLAVRHAELLLAANDLDGYRRYREWMLQQIARLGTGPASSFARTCALVPAESSDAARLIQLAEKGLDPKSQNSIGVLGYALYRGGRYDEAIARLREVTGHSLHDLVLAMALWRRGDQDAARQLLVKSQTAYDQETRKALAASAYKRPPWNWRDFACFQILYREARALIEGGAAAGDENAASLQARARAEFVRRDPLTADFDQALMVEPKQPRHWLARGRRLAELGRFDEALADFNKAVELGANDPEVLAARALHFADHGEAAKAAADFHAALRLFDDTGAKPRWYFGVPIDFEVAQRDDVLEQLRALRPLDPRPLLTRMVLSMQRGDIGAAKSAAQSLAAYGYAQPGWLAAAARWRGDDAEFARLRASSADPNPNAQIMLIGLAPTDGALTAKIQTAGERMWREQPQDRWHRRWLGLAQLRAGQWTEAAASLETSLDPGDRWEQDRLVWPLLAIAHHQLKNAEPARRWLNRTEHGMELGAQAGPGELAAGTAIPGMLPEEWLYGMLFYLEAKTLIDGPDAARTERERLAALARGRSQVILAKADAARQQSLAKVEAARQESLAKAEAAWNRAVELAGDNPLPWIQRGRWYLERGEQAKADADFAKAATLTPD